MHRLKTTQILRSNEGASGRALRNLQSSAKRYSKSHQELPFHQANMSTETIQFPLQVDITFCPVNNTEKQVVKRERNISMAQARPV